MGFETVAVGLVENQIGEIELHDVMQPRRELGKKPVQFPVRRDRFGYFEKRLILAVQKIRLLALDSGVFHGCKIISRWIANQDGKLVDLFRRSYGRRCRFSVDEHLEYGTYNLGPAR